MCNPAVIPIAMAAVSAIGSGLGAAGNAKTAKEQAKLSLAQTKATMQNYAAEVNATNTRFAQEQEKAHEDQQQVYLQNLQAKATAQASAAGSGVTGISIDNLFNGYDRASAISDFITERNIRNMGLQFNENLQGLRTRAISSVNNQTLDNNLGIKQSSTLLSGIGGILSSVGSYQSKK